LPSDFPDNQGKLPFDPFGWDGVIDLILLGHLAEAARIALLHRMARRTAALRQDFIAASKKGLVAQPFFLISEVSRALLFDRGECPTSGAGMAACHRNVPVWFVDAIRF